MLLLSYGETTNTTKESGNMIQNPYIGMKVRIRSPTALVGNAFNREGIIIDLHNSGILPIVVRFQDRIRGAFEWSFAPNELEPAIPLTLQEKARIEDQKRREEHAERYL